MNDKRRPLSLLVVLSTLLLCQASAQVRDVRPSTQEEQPKTSLPIDILGLQANEDVATMFGLRLFNDIHTKMARCREDRRKIEAKYNNQSKHIHQYYGEVERVILKPTVQLEDLVHENSQDIETNFENAFKELEKSRDKKLKRLEARCKAAMSSFMDAKIKEAVAYADTLMVQDPVAFMRLTFDVSAYANQLRGVLPTCSHGNRPHPPSTKGTVDPNSHGVMNFDLCYVSEIRQVISFIDHFLVQTDELRQRYYGDDEDFYDVIDDKEESLSGDFPPDDSEPEIEKPVPTQQPPATKARPTVQGSLNAPISGFFEPGPVILGKPKDDKPHDDKEKKPAPTGDTPTTEQTNDPMSPIPIDSLFEPGPVIIETEKNNTPLPTKEILSKEPTDEDHLAKPDEKEVSDYDSDDKKATESPSKEEPTTKAKPTPAEPEWVNEAFITIIGPEEDKERKDNAEEQSDLEEKEFKTPARSRSRSKSKEEEGPRNHGNIDLNLPGVDVQIGSNGNEIDIEANIAQQGADQSLNIGGSIVFDDDPEFTTAGSSEDEDSSFITYMLIYFFATLGSLLLLTILVLSIAIIALRMRNGRTPKDTPILSEEEKIAVMKQTGYVNPTYKFFDSNVKDV